MSCRYSIPPWMCFLCGLCVCAWRSVVSYHSSVFVGFLWTFFMTCTCAYSALRDSHPSFPQLVIQAPLFLLAVSTSLSFGAFYGSDRSCMRIAFPFL